ncbi:MAG TPA: hypothetical protein VER55_05805, partial [Ardenticatenaceae bacterium]|nr:hypothetical protein [Ardenticatenaceae bacterium]
GVDPFFEESVADPAGPGGVFPAAPGAAAGSDQAQPLPTLTPRAVETVAMALNQPLPPAGLPASSGLPAPVPAHSSVDTFLMLMSTAFAMLAVLAGVGIVWLVVRRPTV